jgi:hypothetical protein
MKFCKKFAVGKQPVVLGHLSPEMVGNLASFYACSIDPGKITGIQRILAWGWELGYWFLCPCNPDATACWLPCRVANRYYLRRMEERAKHLENCPFEYRVYRPSSPSTDADSHSKPLNLHRSISDEIGTHAPAPSNRSVNRKFRLSGFLFDLAGRAGTNRISCRIPSPIQTAQSLANAVRGELLAKGVPAEELFFVGVGTSPYPQSIAALEADRHLWPNGVRPYALAAGIFDEIKDGTLICHQTNTSVACKGQVKRLQCTGPYLVLGTIAEDLTIRGKFIPIHAFGLPVASRLLWFPVASYYERMVFLRLHWSVRNILGTAHRITIEKPLRPFEPIEGMPQVFPDFILHSKFGKLVIEVMGSETHDYTETKKRLIPIMAHLGPVLTINACSIERRCRWLLEFDKLTDFLCAWINEKLVAGEVYDLESFPVSKGLKYLKYVQCRQP